LKPKGLAIASEALVGRFFALHDKIAAAFGAESDRGELFVVNPSPNPDGLMKPKP
jgi:hypothetical protein